MCVLVHVCDVNFCVNVQKVNINTANKYVGSGKIWCLEILKLSHCSQEHNVRFHQLSEQEAQLSPRDRAMRHVSRNFASCHATMQKLLERQVLNQVSAAANRPM